MKLEIFGDRAYLALAYSGGKDYSERAKVADIVSAYLMETYGYHVFSPISQSHRVARYVDVGHLSHEFWLGQDLGFMEVCDRCVVLNDELWKKSFGVAFEIGWFMAKGIPIEYLPWDEVVNWAKYKGVEI